MNLIAGNGHRKWPYGAPRRMAPAMVTGVAAFFLFGIHADARPVRLGDLFGDRPPRLRGTLHSVKIPLPKPRPSEAPAAETPAAEASPAPAPQPSACRLALTEEIAIAPSIPDIQGPGGCGGTDLVKLEAIVLPSKRRVAVTPAATLRCSMATAIADWARTDLVPLTEKLGSELSVLDNFDSYECRGFNGVPGAHLSEHGHANALDVRALKLADGRTISLTDRTVSRELREAVLHSVCARFMTVLGPGSDWYHEDHIHLDLMERRSNYKICQWNVYDPLPQIAPLMPSERPDEAPPREVAAKSGADRGKPETAKSEAAEPQAAEEAEPDHKPEPASSPAKKPATKKRR
jgi:hypothetical protein